MKSNEEFIAGIYEKAAAYTEEKETKVVKVDWVAKATRIAAMAAVCIGLAGIGTLVLGRGNTAVPGETPSPADDNYGIAMTSETGDNLDGIALLREGPEAESVTFTGVVERVDSEEMRIVVQLSGEERTVYIKWDMLEPISKELAAGAELTATGVLSEYNGCAELILTDVNNLEIK